MSNATQHPGEYSYGVSTTAMNNIGATFASFGDRERVHMVVKFLRVLSLILRDVAAVIDDASELAANDPPTPTEEYVEVPVGESRDGNGHEEGDGASMMQSEVKRRRLQEASMPVTVRNVLEEVITRCLRHVIEALESVHRRCTTSL